MIFVEFGDCGFEGEIAARDLKFLDEIGGSGEEDASTLLDQGQTERRCEMGFPGAGRGSDMAPGFWRARRRSTTRFIRSRVRQSPRAVGALFSAASFILRSGSLTAH